MRFDIFKNAFNDVIFDEATHSYKANDESLISVTTLLAKYSQEFNSDLIAEKTAKKRNVDKQELLNQWEEKGRKASERGTALHLFISEFFNSKHNMQLKEDNQYFKIKSQFVEFYESFMIGKQIIYSEKVLYLKDRGLAGTIDCLVYSPEEKMFYYIDWKTNDEISKSNSYNNLKFPLNRYDQSSLNTYSLQISLYRYMIEEAILNKSLEWEILKNNSKNLIVQFSELNDSYTVFETPYLKFSVIQLLNHYKQTKGN